MKKQKQESITTREEALAYGLSFPGTYKEIFSSDAAKYGGEGNNNKQQKVTKDGDIEIVLPALSITVLKKVK